MPSASVSPSRLGSQSCGKAWLSTVARSQSLLQLALAGETSARQRGKFDSALLLWPSKSQRQRPVSKEVTLPKSLTGLRPLWRSGGQEVLLGAYRGLLAGLTKGYVSPAILFAGMTRQGWYKLLAQALQHRRKPPAAKGSYLVDPASSHMLVSKIKPCMSKYKLLIL